MKDAPLKLVWSHCVKIFETGQLLENNWGSEMIEAFKNQEKFNNS